MMVKQEQADEQTRKQSAKPTRKQSNKQTNEQNERPVKHWTEVYKECKRNTALLRNKGCYEDNLPEIGLPIGGCGFGDEHFIFDEEDGYPKYEESDEPWNNFIQWVESVCVDIKDDEKYKGRPEYHVGQEIASYAKQRNAHGVFIKMIMFWVEFRDTFLLREGCPENILEFVRAIMHGKMTEKQMWGTVEDRCPGGTVIVFEKEFMPKEGEDTGSIKFEYHPNYREEMMEKMRQGGRKK